MDISSIVAAAARIKTPVALAAVIVAVVMYAATKTFAPHDSIALLSSAGVCVPIVFVTLVFFSGLLDWMKFVLLILGLLASLTFLVVLVFRLAPLAAGSESSGPASRIVEKSSDVLWDPLSKLEWRRNDNGENISWPQALAYCEGLSDGWRLPSKDELLGVIERNMPANNSCLAGAAAPTYCFVSKLFHLGNGVFWSNDVAGPDKAVFVNFIFPTFKEQPTTDKTMRALCVRSPKS